MLIFLNIDDSNFNNSACNTHNEGLPKFAVKLVVVQCSPATVFITLAFVILPHMKANITG